MWDGRGERGSRGVWSLVVCFALVLTQATPGWSAVIVPRDETPAGVVTRYDFGCCGGIVDSANGKEGQV